MANHQLVFICGALRSGSTMLRLMLDNHPNIVNPGEFDFLFDYMHEDGSYPNTNQLCESLKLNRIFNAKNLLIDDALSADELIKSFVQQLSADNEVLALNIHRHFERIPYLFPNAKFVHLLRDPRDVAKSCMNMGWAGNVYFGVDLWMATEQSWDLLTTKIASEQYMALRYEDIVMQPEAELARLCQFIGINYAPSMLEYDSASTYDKPNSALAWQWRKKLSAKEVALVEAKTHKLMAARHYEVVNSNLYPPNALEKIALLLQNKWFKLNHGLQRYGFALFFGEKLTKLLGLTSVHKHYVQEKNKIDIKHLK